MNDEEKTQLNILFKNYKGVPFTNKNIFYLEENEIVGISRNAMFQNDYIIFESILMDKIPKEKNTIFAFYPPDDGSPNETFSGENYDSKIASDNIKSTFVQIDKTTSIYGYNIEQNEMKANGFCHNVLQYYDENNYPILQKLIHLPLEPIDGTSSQSWFKLSKYSDDSNDNILKYSLPEFPGRWHDDIPIGDVMSGNNIDLHSDVYRHFLYYSIESTNSDRLIPNGIIDNSTWNFDLKNGIITFHDDIDDSRISESTPPLLTFVKYVGRKNVDLNKLMENSLIFKKESVNIINNNGPNYVLDKLSKVNTEDSGGTILDLSGVGYIKIPFKDINDNANNMQIYKDLGAIRYDTVENAFEGYHGVDGWKSIGGGSGNTSDNSGTEIRISKKDEKEKINGKFNSNFYTHTIEFYTKEPLSEGDGKSKRRMIINKNGDIDISNNLKIDGSATIKKDLTIEDSLDIYNNLKVDGSATINDLTVSQDLYAKNIYLDIDNVSVYTLLDNHVKDISENLWRILNDAPKAFDTLNEVGTFLMDVSDNVFIQINQDIQDISSRSVWKKNGNDIVIETGNVGIGTTDSQAKLHIRNDAHTTSLESEDAYIPDLISNQNRRRKPAECLRLQGKYTDANGSGALLRFTNWHNEGQNPSSKEYNLAGIAGYDHDHNWGGGLCLYTAPGRHQSLSNTGGGNLIPRMIIDNYGKVGIGTTSPKAKLSINGKIYFQGDDTYTSYGISFYHNEGSSEKKILYYSSADKRTIIRGVNDGTIADSFDGGILFKNENDNDLMLLSSNGNVGIGTTDPQTPLDIKSSGNNCLCLRNGNSGGADTKSQILLSYAGSAYNSSGAHSHKIQSRHQSSASHHQNAIDFYLWKSGQSSNDIGDEHGMSITAQGVGIGTDNPGEKLQVNGNVIFQGKLTFNQGGFGVIQAYDAYHQIFIRGNRNGVANEMHFYEVGDFAFSNGGTTSVTERMRITEGGNVGIGTSTPTRAKLVLNVASNGTAIASNDVNQYIWRIDRDQKWGIYWHTDNNQFKLVGNDTAYHIFETDGTVYGDKGSVWHRGNVVCGGDITAFYGSSDKRLKTNINTIENAVEIVQKLRGVRFNWNEEAHKINEHVDLEKKEIGVIAQEVEEHLPEVVKKGLSDYKAIRYEKITPLLIEAIKEQQQQINEQQQQINEQKQQINEILNQLNNNYFQKKNT